jgi:hypothetical protein
MRERTQDPRRQRYRAAGRLPARRVGRPFAGSRSAAAVLAILALAVLTPACQSSRYRIERPLGCEDANAELHGALLARDYEITRFELAEPGGTGVVEAERMTPDGRRHGSVRVRCDHTVTFQPIEGVWFLPDYEFSREVYYALLARTGPAAGTGGGASHAAAPTSGTAADARPGAPGGPADTGRLDVVLRPLDRFEIRKLLGVDLEGWGLYVVRVRIANGTRRALVVPPNAVALVDEQGERIQPLAAPGIEEALRRTAETPRGAEDPPLPPLDVPGTARDLAARALPSGPLPPEATREGFLCFPERPYRHARVGLVDEETGEVEGTIVGL